MRHLLCALLGHQLDPSFRVPLRVVLGGRWTIQRCVRCRGLSAERTLLPGMPR